MKDIIWVGSIQTFLFCLAIGILYFVYLLAGGGILSSIALLFCVLCTCSMLLNLLWIAFRIYDFRQ